MSNNNKTMAKPGIFRVKNKVLGTVGICCVGIGLILTFSWPLIFEFILNKQLVLTPDSRTYTLWRNVPVPISMNFYFYNWTNPEELGIRKPNLVEIGPYSFDEIDEKVGIVWNENGTITFQKKRKWYFNEQKSVGSLDDEILTLNPVALSAARSVKYWSYLLKKSLSLTISSKNQKVHVKHTVGQLLFHGYSDPLLDIALKLPAFAGVDMPYDKFAWFYTRNDSSKFEGVFNMDTGVNNISNFGKLHNWNYGNHTPFYENSCGHVRGTAGEVFRTKWKTTDEVEMFSADLCRSVSLKFDEEVYVEGLKGNKYIGGREIVDNGTLDSENECFCDGECVPSGVINVTSCRLGAPGFISFPHFQFADPFYLDQVEGLKPDPEKHILYIVLEPTTGIPLDVAARFQINLLLSPSDSISLYQNVPTIFFPMMWFEQRATITEELAYILKLVLALPSIGQGIALTILTSGLLILVIYIYLIFANQQMSTEEKKGIEELALYKSTAHPLLLPMEREQSNSESVPCIT